MALENSLKNIFAVSELRNRVLFTLGMLGVYRIGHHITVPGVNIAALAELARQMQNQMFGLYDMFSGGNLSRVTIFALGIMPYISTSFIMWLGEQITERGIGNGMSLIIYSGIVVNFPRAVLTTFDQMRTGQLGLIRILFLLVLMAVVVAAIVFVERGHRRVTVQYAKRVVGRRMYGGGSKHIPLKVNNGGGLPGIFAASPLAVPYTIAQAVPGRAGGGAPSGPP